MAVKIVHAKMDENGKIDGPLVGDQTGKEIRTQDFYLNDSMYLLICKDEQMARAAADTAVQIANDDHYGYSQKTRFTGYNSIKANGGIVSGGSGSFDCATLVVAAYKLNGLSVPIDVYTGNLVQKFQTTGMFTVLKGSPYTDRSDYAEFGALYVRPKTGVRGGHVFMALGSSKKAGATQDLGGNVLCRIIVDGVKQWCNVRSGAGTEFLIIGKAYKNDKFDVYGVVDGWYKVGYKGQVGYIFGDYASEVLPGNV